MAMDPMAMAIVTTVSSATDLVTTRLIVGKTTEMQARDLRVTRPTKPSAIDKTTETTSYLVSLRSR